MKLSELAKKINPSPTLALNEKANILKKEGKKVIHLGGGEPKEKSPQAAIEKAKELLDSGFIRYTPTGGTIELKNAIQSFTKKNYGIDISAKNIIASSGAKQSLMDAFYAILNPTDEVIYATPFWVSYPDMVELAGGKSVIIQVEKSTLIPTLEQFTSKITSKTKIILLNSPNNPSGVIYSNELVKSLVEICEEKEIYLIMDDIYRELVFAGNLSPNAFGFTTKEIDNSYIITINGVSKQFSMTGFRIGWAVGNKEVISAMNRIQGHQTSCPSAISQVATIGAIESGENEANNLKFNLEKKKNVLVQLLSEIPNIHFVKPQGTFYCFVDFSYYEKSSHKLAEYFIDKVEVITIPGKDFGMEGFLRISYCGEESELHEGLARIKTALQNY